MTYNVFGGMLKLNQSIITAFSVKLRLMVLPKFIKQITEI